MKKIFIVLTIASASFAQAFAQDVTDAQAAAEQAAAAIADAPKEEAEAPAPKYWSESVLTNISFTQLLLKNWAAGGFNAFTLAVHHPQVIHGIGTSLFGSFCVPLNSILIILFYTITGIIHISKIVLCICISLHGSFCVPS